MQKNLVIVESPTKARTIARFLGKDFVVESSFGHIRDLPTSTLGVDPEHNFEPHYVIPARARPAVKKLKMEAEKASQIILATDEDREGEAIAWHLVQALGLNESPPQEVKDSGIKAGSRKPKAVITKPKAAIARIVFHEITKKAIEEALRRPRAIDMKLVDAQQARRVLDRLVGYKLSPFLWKKLYRGLSAGRVQSIAVRLIVEREREIQNFKPEEYWNIEATLATKKKESFVAALSKINDETLDKFAIKNGERAQKIIDDLKEAEWTVAHVEKRAVSRNPLPPFTTSTLQQEAFRRLGFSAKQTMVIAQQLYEGVELGEGPVGLISYMRTDSLNMSEEALREAHAFLKKEIGESYCLPSPRRFKTKTKGAQEAHEAIRPTDPWRTPDSIKDRLDRRQYRLYNLIWQKFIATQMPPAIFDATTIDVAAVPNSKFPASAKDSIFSKLSTNKSAGGQVPSSYTFRATGQIMKFDGFLKIYPIKFTELTLPELAPQESLDLMALTPGQHFTEPPPRYTEASLVKILEKNGIGRPSTYAPIISTIQDRGYAEKYERRNLKPTETGFLVNDMLVEHFPQIVDTQFTAKMEEELDEIASGEKEWQPVIRAFYEPFAKNLEEKYLEVKKHEVAEATDEVCEKCGKPMVIKLGRFGKFLACSGFPECKNTKTIKQEPQTIGMKCPTCGEGEIVMRFTRRKRMFYGCSRYPDCGYASWQDPRKEKSA